jgi:hypothetical protein
VAGLGRVGVHFASPAEKTVGCHKAIDLGMGVGRSLAERDIRLAAADKEEVVKGLARMIEVAGKEELEQGLE